MASAVVKQVKKGTIDDWLAETWKVCLLSNAFTYNSNTHITYATLTNEISGTGYTAGGATITKRAWGSGSGYVDTTNANLDANDTSWTGASFTARWAVVYNVADGTLRQVYDLGGDKTVTSGTFTIIWNSGGMIKIS